MRWLWLVGSLKTKVSFAKEPDKRNYILCMYGSAMYAMHTCTAYMPRLPWIMHLFFESYIRTWWWDDDMNLSHGSFEAHIRTWNMKCDIWLVIESCPTYEWLLEMWHTTRHWVMSHVRVSRIFAHDDMHLSHESFWLVPESCHNRMSELYILAHDDMHLSHESLESQIRT